MIDINRTPAVTANLLALAREEPHVPVMTTDATTITRGELVAAASQLANAINDAVPDGAIGVLPRDGIELAIGIVAALLVGRAFVPIDRALPGERLERLAEAAGVTVTVGDPILHLHAGHAVGHIETQRSAGPDRPPIQEPSVSPTPDDPALLAFTSGTTGDPKLRIQTFADLGRYVDKRRPPTRIERHDRFGTLLGASAGVVRRILEALTHGASIVCVDARTIDERTILDVFAEQKITYLSLVPTYLRRLAAAESAGSSLPDLRLVSLFSEAITWSDVRTVRERLSATCVVRHGYGTTETGGICELLIPADQPLASGRVPVGVPHHDTRVWIRGDEGQPEAAGQSGEIIVERPDVRGGVEHEATDDGRVRYRTGDVGLINDQGQLEVLGRLDDVVKIGGLHIGLGDVADRISGVEGVLDVRVVANRVSEGNLCLDAHVAIEPNASADISDRIDAMAARELHSAAVPRTVHLYHHGFPTLPSGKVDLRRLRDSATTWTTAENSSP